MSTFWKGFCEVTVGFGGFPIAVVGGIIDSVINDKPLSEALDDANDLHTEAIKDAGEFGATHGHELTHAAGKIIEHVIKRR